MQLLAEKRNIFPVISTNYEPKAESEDSLRIYLKNNLHTFRILFSMQFVLYAFALLGSPCLIVFLLYGRPHKLKDIIFNSVKKQEIATLTGSTYDYNWWEARTLLHFISISSIWIWLYAFGISMAGLISQTQALNHEIMEIHRLEHESFNLLYGLTPLIFVQNFLTPIFSTCIYIALMAGFKKLETKYGLESKEDVENRQTESTQTENTQIISTETENTRTISTQTENTRTISTQTEPIASAKFSKRLIAICFLSLPITTFAVHFTHIVIGFIHSPVHATSVGVFYSFVLLATVLLFKTLSSVYYILFIQEVHTDATVTKPPVKPRPEPAGCCKTGCCTYNCKKYKHEIGFCIMYFISHSFLLGLFAYIASLYFLLPINRAIDIAPTQLNGFVTTLVFAFAGYTIYHLLKSHKKKE